MTTIYDDGDMVCGVRSRQDDERDDARWLRFPGIDYCRACGEIRGAGCLPVCPYAPVSEPIMTGHTDQF